MISLCPNILFPDEKVAKIALIGTLIPFVIGIFSVASGWLCDKFGVRVCIVAGAFATAIAHVLASLGTRVWHLILTQGVLYGVGGALVYIPAIMLVTEWFEKRQGLAVGIGAAGAGGALFTQVNFRLLLALGHVWTLCLNGAFHLLALLLVATTVRRREQTDKGSENTKSLVLNGSLIWFAAACLFGGIGYLNPLHFVMQHTASLNMTTAEGGYILIAMNLGSGVGRVSMGLLGDYTGLMKSYMLAICLSILASVMWLFSTKFAVMLIFGIVYGISSGGYVGSFGAACSILFGNLNCFHV
ncbi:hypothetical protein DSO57_1033331 [Entomophthora muscae]|uniref:Uncharacterized protein n=1 Tax=Entomophthora muscae TaxID=34485 RepID=A0ACC2UKY9_9FUNG|nr:hypothetical protein DSO57_1033331 [Entomophthora muscae]